MFIIFIFLWIIALMLILINPKNSWSWWAALCLFLNGFGGISVIFKDTFIPLAENTQNQNVIFFAQISKGFADIMLHYFATYALVIFTLNFTNYLNLNPKKKVRIIINILLSLPSFLMVFMYPLTPEFEPNYIVLSLWVVPFTIMANLILIINTFQEKNPQARKNRLYTCLFCTPSTLAIMWTSYLSTAIGFHGVWYLNFWIIVYQFGMFLFLATKFGIFGVKLRLEKTNYENTINTIIDGNSVISKAINYESFEINSCIEAIRKKENISSSLEEKLSMIEIATNNLREITAKISYKLDRTNIEPEPGILSIIIESAISVVQEYAQSKNIRIRNKSNIDATILLDTIKVTEVIKNILLNSIEAIENDGIIKIETEIRGDNLILFITDNGIGIVEENIDKVTTPFFSTKPDHKNLGLGLSYCYRIMKAHEGNIRIRSKQNKGTVLQLIFPKNRVLNTSNRVFMET